MSKNNYTDKEVDAFLKDIDKTIIEMTEELKAESAEQLKTEISEKHGHKYDIEIKDIPGGKEIFTTDKKAIELEFNNGIPAWRSVHAKHRAKGN